MEQFKGFKPSFFAFFKDIEQNNNRDWFMAHKKRYEQEVVVPVLDFIEAMAEPLEAISPHFLAVPKKHGGSMFRIYRDQRFGRNQKTPYKINAAIQFRHMNGRDAHAPGFYVHLEPGNIRFGGGIWMPGALQLKKIRLAIAHDQEHWTRVKTDRQLCEMFGDVRGERLTKLQGDRLKRSPRGFDPEHPHIEDLKLKSFFVMYKTTAGKAARGDFLEDVLEGFAAASALMRFLCRAIGSPY
ncbi:MAG: DUF2461 domain-containing protein [Hyphomicrobiaceae bacterium]|nr:DUF2461 domain-containing protein [Hyphomicrobiaceae bacterium]